MKIQNLIGLTASSLFLAVLPLSAAVILNDSFITVPAPHDPAQGEYLDGGALSGVDNRTVSGGSIVGFSAGNQWVVSGTGLPILTGAGLSSGSLTTAGGAISYRGNATTDNRMAYRLIDGYTGPDSTYFSGTLMTNFLDDDALSLIAFTNSGGVDRGNGILANDGSVYYNGLAFGFKGNGNGGMDLIVRYRTATTTVYTDHVLVSGISTNAPYTVMGRIDWETAEQNLRDPFTVWVNPASATEPAEGGTSLIGFLGTNTNIDAVYLLQKDYGTELAQTVYMDELRLGGSWDDLAPIPEPSAYALFFGLAVGAAVWLRRRR